MFSLMSRRSKRSTSGRMGGYDSVAVRVARAEDESAIHRIASLDGKKAPAGRVLVAEADAEIIAALPIGGGQAVADPFRWTADVVALMEMRAEQLAQADLVPVSTAGGAVRSLRTQLSA
jgi:hypothetical protein